MIQRSNTDRFRVLAHSAVAVARASANDATDANQVTAATVVIPAGAMGANGLVRVTSFWTYTNSANTKTLRVAFGGTNFTALSATTTATARLLTPIANRNATNSQVGGPTNYAGISTSTAAPITAAIDTTAAVNLTFTTAWGGAVAGETITLENYLVELLYKA